MHAIANNTNSSFYSNQIGYINFTSNLFGYYIIPGLSFIGFILNLSIFILLFKNNFKHRFYKYLSCKSLIDTILCLIGIVSTNSFCHFCHENSSNTYFVFILKIYTVRFSLRIFLVISSFLEIFLYLNRYMTIKNKKNIFSNIRIEILMISLFTTAFLFFLPYLHFIRIIKVDDEYTIDYTKSMMTIIYSMIITILEILFPIISVLALNIIIQKSYRTRIKRKPIRKAKFIKIVILLGITYVIFRSSDFICALISRIFYFFKIDNKYWEALVNLLRNISFSLLFFSLSINVIIYFTMDKNIFALVKKYLRIVSFLLKRFQKLGNNINFSYNRRIKKLPI